MYEEVEEKLQIMLDFRSTYGQDQHNLKFKKYVLCMRKREGLPPPRPFIFLVYMACSLLPET
jgi:hypothetical protein